MSLSVIMIGEGFQAEKLKGKRNRKNSRIHDPDNSIANSRAKPEHAAGQPHDPHPLPSVT